MTALVQIKIKIEGLKEKGGRGVSVTITREMASSGQAQRAPRPIVSDRGYNLSYLMKSQ